MKKNQKKELKQNRYFDFVGLAIIILLGILIYSNSFICSFHFDDISRIVNNPGIRNLEDVKAWMNIYPSRPVAMFTFALNYHFNQMDVRYYHLVNLIIHLINACLVWWLTLLIFSSPALKNNPVIRHKKALAFFTALLFVSHPLATQSVTYIIQRMTSMAAMFYLLSLALYLKARTSDKKNRAKTLLFTGSLISAVLAMLTKENAFTLPFAIGLVELFFIKTKKLAINFRDYRVILIIAALLGIIIIIPLKFSFGIFKPIPPMFGHEYTVTPLNYLFTQFSVIVKYIQLLFLPVNQKVDYDFPVSDTFFELRTLSCFVFLLVLIILAVLSFKRYRIISFGIFWFFLTLSVESGFIPINDMIYEHRTYLPSFGFFLILTSGLYLLLWNKHKYLAIAILVIIIGSDSYLTYQRNKVWKDEFSLWNDNVAKTPHLPRAFLNRGLVYGNLGQWDMAITDFSKALEIDPGYSGGYYNRGVAYGNIGQWDKAITDFSNLIRIDPGFNDAYYNRGVAWNNLGQCDKAIADYSRAIEVNPHNAKAYCNRGTAYGSLGQWDKAITDYTRAIKSDPNFSMAYSNLGVAYSNLARWDKAIAEYSKAIELDPNNTKAFSDREEAYSKLHIEKK
jgi:tetratricopeptide (TPR) repeat protein